MAIHAVTDNIIIISYPITPSIVAKFTLILRGACQNKQLVELQITTTCTCIIY